MYRSILTGFLILSFALICLPATAYSQDATAAYNNGINFTQSGNYTAALLEYEQAVTLEPSYYEAWNGIADILNRNRDFANALNASDNSLNINPRYVKGWINRGQILYNIGYVYEDKLHNTDKANLLYNEQILAFENATTIDPNDSEAWFNLAYALAGVKRYDEAIADFDKVATLDPNYPKLAANRAIAVQLRDASTPWYVKNAMAIEMGVVIFAGIGTWAYLRKKE